MHLGNIFDEGSSFGGRDRRRSQQGHVDLYRRRVRLPGTGITTCWNQNSQTRPVFPNYEWKWLSCRQPARRRTRSNRSSRSNRLASLRGSFRAHRVYRSARTLPQRCEQIRVGYDLQSDGAMVSHRPSLWSRGSLRPRRCSC